MAEVLHTPKKRDEYRPPSQPQQKHLTFKNIDVTYNDQRSAMVSRPVSAPSGGRSPGLRLVSAGGEGKALARGGGDGGGRREGLESERGGGLFGNGGRGLSQHFPGGGNGVFIDDHLHFQANHNSNKNHTPTSNIDFNKNANRRNSQEPTCYFNNPPSSSNNYPSILKKKVASTPAPHKSSPFLQDFDYHACPTVNYSRLDPEFLNPPDLPPRPPPPLPLERIHDTNPPLSGSKLAEQRHLFAQERAEHAIAHAAAAAAAA
eukprot:CAMPEP_0175055988 /NCGR_PEP_ID=MMETSP0052_2-20121109/10407_1 /TAXON_ID=51329 ORGANISM="Polytomella parva, Strain SAG 63-3" /NCGR_SAMPLE_ID=MMETSP0052_2 /ASSEMBLY_ACC=CAM_ASM_000194 /LENGTH=260 /DNA_ID=CAMNT_0016320937 /DNA_START=274 /DNA_END=1053 /DNA_ORIENTATION=+